jgi:hypothetical protein
MDSELIHLADLQLGLGRLNGLDLRANRDIIHGWLYREHRDRMEIALAIEGAAAMRDAGLIGWDKLTPSTPLSCKALVKAPMIADQGDGTVLRPLYDVAVDYMRTDEPNTRGRGAEDGLKGVSQLLGNAGG